MKAIIGGLVAGFAAYHLIKWIRSGDTTGRYFVSTDGSNYTEYTPNLERTTNLFEWWKNNKLQGFGDEAGVYAYLYDLRGQLKNSTGIYSNSVRKIEDLDMKLVKANDEYVAAEAERRPTILFRVAEIQRQRDLAVLEAELILRNVIGPLREKLLTEEARLKSAVVSPEIALSRVGKIPAF